MDVSTYIYVPFLLVFYQRCKIIMATMVLHNICIYHGLHTVIDTVDETIDDTITPHSSGSGELMRQEIVSTFFY